MGLPVFLYSMTSEAASILFQNAILPSADGKETVVDLLINDGKIERIATHIDSTGFKGVRIDATGMHLLPGLVDLHVHFREPGFEYKETIDGGAEAAAAGGFTTVCTMPNLNPAPDSPATLSPQLEAIAEAEKKWPVEIRPYATITMERKGREVVDFKSLETFAREAGHLLAGFSDDGSGIQEAEPMRSALESSSQGNYLIAAHCEVNSLLKGGYIHDGEWAKAHGMKGICSESEWKEIERDIDLLRQTGGRLHICHVSTKESIALIAKAKKEGLHITCETAPHYIAFCEDDLEDDGRFKMNPPLRASADRDVLRQALADGIIDAVATDHAPHSAEEKSRGLKGSAMGIVGLETSLAAIYTYMVSTGRMSLWRMIEAMSLAPRRILGMSGERDGLIKEGRRAELTLVDLKSVESVDSKKFHGSGRATPFEGADLTGKVMATVNTNKIYISENLKPKVSQL